MLWSELICEQAETDIYIYIFLLIQLFFQRYSVSAHPLVRHSLFAGPTDSMAIYQGRKNANVGRNFKYKANWIRIWPSSLGSVSCFLDGVYWEPGGSRRDPFMILLWQAASRVPYSTFLFTFTAFYINTLMSQILKHSITRSFFL